MLLAALLLISAIPNWAAAEGSDIGSIKFGEKEYFGYPISASYLDNSVCSVQDGHNIIGSVIEGSPAVFFVYDLDDGKVLGQYPIEGATYAHGHGVAPNGDIYMTTQAAAKLARYSPTTKKFEILGELYGEHASYQVSFDEAGNAYVGTYPGGKIIKYDPQKNEFYDYGNILEGEKYVRAHIYHDGYIYAGGYHPETKFVRLNVKTGEIEQLETPVFDILPKNGIKLFYFMDVVSDPVAGDFIICDVYPLQGTSMACIYDLKQQKWVDYFPGIYGYQFTRQLNDGVTYMVQNIGITEKGEYVGIKDPQIVGYNFRTGEVEKTGIRYINDEVLDSFRGASLIELKDQQTYPGKSIATVSYEYGVPVIVNLETKTVDVRMDAKDQLLCPPIEIRAMGTGSGNLIGYGGYKAREAGVFNTENQLFTKFPMEQVEGVGTAGGKIYFGKYAGAYLMEYDPQKPPAADNPKQVAKLGEEQDRIFHITEAEGKVVMSSTPITTALGGALSIYDPETGKTDVYRNLVKDQSVTCSVYRDGVIYASTHIWGGLGVEPVEKNAQVFAFDLNSRKVIKSVTPQLNGFKSDIMHIGGMVFGDDGLLWALARGTIFAMNPDTLEIVKQKQVDPSYYTPDKQIYKPYNLIKLKNGLFVGKFASGITVFDPKTMESKKISDTCYDMALGNDGDLYVTDYKNFYRLPIYYQEEQMQESTQHEKLSQTIALMLGENHGLASGRSVPIDAGNPDVVAKTVDDRTVVPIRFIAEAAGAQVEWNDALQKVTVKTADREIVTVLGEKKITVNGEDQPIDVAAREEEGRTLLPLRAFVEAMGHTVYWDERGLILITPSVLYDKTFDKELIDHIIHTIKPALLIDEKGNGKKDPAVEALKANVIINQPEYKSKIDYVKWEEIPFNSDLKQGELQTEDITVEGADGKQATVTGMTYGLDQMRPFRYLTGGEYGGSDFSKNPQKAEIVESEGKKALLLDSPVSGNALNLYMPVLKFDETYPSSASYKLTFKAKRADERPISGEEAFRALIRFTDEKNAKIDQTAQVNIKPSDTFVDYEIIVPANSIPKNATRLAGLFYHGSTQAVRAVMLTDIRLYIGR